MRYLTTAILILLLVLVAVVYSSTLKSASLKKSKQLFNAVHASNLTRVEEAIADGADVNLRIDTTGITPLMLACMSNELEIANELLSAGANPDATDSNLNNALQYSAERGYTEIVETLLQHGASAVPNPYSHIAPPQHLAVWKGHLETLKALIDGGASKDERDSHGGTPLHWAARDGQTETVMYLLSIGASTSLKDNKGRTALDLALANAHNAIASMLSKPP